MTRIYFNLLVFICSISVAQGQSIKGTIQQPDGQPAEFSTIMLMLAKDSSFVKGAVADVAGNYEIEGIEKGSYFLQASAVGFEKNNSNTIIFEGTNITAPILKLNALSTELAGVTITATKPVMEVKPDRIIFNVENSPNATGLNALELLRKSPGVTVDKDENILLKGRSNVRIYINGKPSPMEGKDLSAFLKGLTSNDIEAIEVISNPGAQFDAEGNGGIVNIRLKKNKKMGYNGSISAGLTYGFTPKYDAALSLNYRNKGWSLFSNYSYNDGTWNNGINLNTTTPTTRFEQSAPNNWQNRGHNFKVGADYSIDSKNTVGVVVNGNTSRGQGSSNSRTNIINVATGKVDSILVASNTTPNEAMNMNYNLNYRFRDTLGHEFSADADYGMFDIVGSSYQPNFYKNADESIILSSVRYRNNTPATIGIQSLKTDYGQNIGKGRLTAGAKVSKVTTVNTFDFFNVKNDDSSVLDIDRSNKFTYNEAIIAGYTNYQVALDKKWNIQVGLRGEQTSAQGDLEAYKPVDSKNIDTVYFNIFPSAGVSYTLNDKNMFSMNYRRSIDRPDYRDLNPFENRIDEITFDKGNPFLRPQFTNSVELSHTYLYAMNTSISFSHTDYFFTQITDRRYDSLSMKESFFITKQNLATRNQYGLSISSPVPIRKWWEAYVSLWFNYSSIKADLGEGKLVNLKAPQGGMWMQHTFNFGKGWSGEVSGWANTKGLWGIFKTSPQGMMDIGVKKNIWDGNGTLQLSFTDVFHTARWTGATDLGIFKMDGNGTWEGQTIKCNFSYRFGNSELKRQDRQTGLESEKNRVKSGK